jgi:Zn-dependent M16 (insulinase) family peptidase
VALESWLYDDSPLRHFSFEPVLEKIKAEAHRGYFETLIGHRLLDNTHSSLLVLAPKKGLAEERDAAIRDSLARYKQSLGPAEIEKLIARNRDLKEHQAAPDREEDLEKLPMLALGDINPKAEKIPRLEKSEGGIRVLHIPLKTSKIAYACLLFDPTVIEEKLIPYVGLVAALLGKINTARRSYAEISNLLNRFTGGTSFSVAAYSENGSAESFLPRFIVNSKILYNDIGRALPLIGEIVTGTSFSDPSRIREVIREMKSRIEMRFAPQGHIIARKRALSYISPVERYEDMVSGISFYRFIATLDREFESRFLKLKRTAPLLRK